METLADWYALRLRPRLDRAAGRGEVERAKIDELDGLMADLLASERLARRAARRATPRPRVRR